MEKTHYRKAFNSPYLSSADIVEPTIFTVAKVMLEPDKSKKTKDVFNTVYFVEREIRKGEPLKPMILNATNSKTMKAIADSPFIDDWAGFAVMIHVEKVKFARDMVDGLRLSTAPHKAQKAELTPDSPNWRSAIEAFSRDGNLAKVLERVNISESNQREIEKQASVS